MAFNIYTWGEANSLATVLSVLDDIANNGDVQLFILTMLIVTGTVTFIRAFLSGRDAISTFVMFFFGTSALLLLFTRINYSVNIIDARDPTAPPAIVDNVPAPVALTAHFFSSFEKTLMDVISTYFQTPSGIDYNSVGYNYGANLFSALPKMNISDPYLRRTLNSFIYDCFYEDILRGNKDFATLVSSTGIWEYLRPFNNASTTIYDPSNISGTIVTCSESYAYLNTQLDTLSSVQLTNVLTALTFLPNGGVNYIPAAFSDFLGQTTNNSALEVFKNTISARYIYEALEYASADSLVSNDIRPYAEQIAKNNIFKNWEVGGNIARELIPVIKNLIQIALFALFPFLFMMVFTPMRGMYIKMFLVLFFWLSLWDPLYAVLTYVAHLRLENLLSGVSLGQGYTMATMGPIFEQSMAHLSAWNYFSLLVPMLAFALAKGSEHALVGLASSVTSAISSGSSSVSGQVASPQGAGSMMGHSREVSMFGANKAFNEAADNVLINAMEKYGYNAANRDFGMGYVQGIPNSAYQSTLQSLSENNTYTGVDSIDIGTAKGVRNLLQSKQFRQEISQFNGDIDSYISKMAKAHGIKNVSEARAYLHAIDSVFGNKDGKLSQDEINAYQDYLNKSELFNLGSSNAKLGEFMSYFKKLGLSDEEALLKSAVLSGQGQAAMNLLHAVEKKGDLSALMELSGNNFEKALQMWKEWSGYKYSRNFSNTKELANLGRKFLGDSSKNLSDFEVIAKMGSIFGKNSAEKEMYENAKWDAFANDIAGAENNEDFLNKLTRMAQLEGSLDASAKEGLILATKKLGLENVKQMVKDKTAGNFFRDIVEGIKNKDLMKALGNGDYKKGIDKYSDILMKRDYSDAQKTQAIMDELINYYKQQGMSDMEALAKASGNLGKFEAFGEEGKISALHYFGDKLRESFKAGRISEVAVALGKFEQAGGNTDELAKYMAEKGKMDVAQAKAMFEFSKFIEEVGKPLGITEKDANNIYQALKEGGHFLSSLNSLNKIGAIAAGAFLLDKFGDAAKEWFKGLDSIDKIRSGSISPTLDRAERRFMEAAKNTALEAIDDEISRIDSELKNANLEERKRQDLYNRRNKLLDERKNISSFDVSDPKQRGALLERLTRDDFTNLFDKGFDVRERVFSRMSRANMVVADGLKHLVGNIDRILANNHVPLNLRENLLDLVEQVRDNPNNIDASRKLADFIDNKLIGEGFLTREEFNKAYQETIKHLESISPEGAKIFTEASGGAKGAFARTGGKIVAGLSRLSSPLGWAYLGADVVTEVFTGKSLTERALEPILSYRTENDAANHIEKLSKNISAYYGANAGNKFEGQVVIGGRTMFDRVGMELGYTEGSVLEFIARYGDGFYSYLNEHGQEFTDSNGNIDLNQARNAYDRILKDKTSKEHDKYVAYLAGNKETLVHPDKNSSGQSRILDFFMEGVYK